MTLRRGRRWAISNRAYCCLPDAMKVPWWEKEGSATGSSSMAEQRGPLRLAVGLRAFQSFGGYRSRQAAGMLRLIEAKMYLERRPGHWETWDSNKRDLLFKCGILLVSAHLQCDGSQRQENQKPRVQLAWSPQRTAAGTRETLSQKQSGKRELTPSKQFCNVHIHATAHVCPHSHTHTIIFRRREKRNRERKSWEIKPSVKFC